MLKDTNVSNTGRKFLKRLLYSGFAFRDAVLMLFGKSQPCLPFTVEALPSSVYFNFRVKTESLEAFSRYINLAPGFEVAPIRVLEDEEPAVLLTLNVYEVSGLALGIRAEWSTYIYDKQAKPRYMVLEARSSEYSMDPIDIITKKGRVEHQMLPGHIRTVVASEEGNLFSANLPLSEVHPDARIALEWITANDYIYWRNGYCDRTYYDENMIAASVRNVPVGDVTITDDTHWAMFLEPVPRHVLKYDGPLHFMIAPWVNIS